jgi:hypothetical protein
MGERAENFERCSGREVSRGYRTFLDSYDGGPRLPDGTLPEFQYTLATAGQLLEPYTLEGTDLTRPYFSAHILHLARLRDAGVLIFDGSDEPVSPERFDSMLTIGTGSCAAAWEKGLPPTHLLVLDPADDSLRCVPTEPPAVVRRVADSFAAWVKKAKRKPTKRPAAKGKTGQRAAKAPTPATLLASFKRKNNLTLPSAYAKFVKGYDGAAPVNGPDGTPWIMATLAELTDPQTGTVTGLDGTRLPAVRVTKVIADELRAQKLKSVPVWGEAKKKFTLARLAKAVSVGHANGDPLFLDPTTKHTVWGYCREGRYVGKVADSFALFLKPKPAKKKAARKTTKARKPAAGRKPRATVKKTPGAPADGTAPKAPPERDARCKGSRSSDRPAASGPTRSPSSRAIRSVTGWWRSARIRASTR